jgi:hypothetical protein
VLFFIKCINMSDVNIESKIFEILGIPFSADILFAVYPLYYTEVGSSETVLLSNI